MLALILCEGGSRHKTQLALSSDNIHSKTGSSLDGKQVADRASRLNYRKSKKYDVNSNFFDEINSAEKAYWLGFLYADGCILTNDNWNTDGIRSMVLEITQKADDYEHLELLRTTLGSNAPIKHRVTKANGKSYPSCRLSICSTDLCRSLIKLGCTPNKSLTLEPPSSEIIPEEFVRDFIRGYLDGDGCVFFKDYMPVGRNQRSYVVNFVAHIK